MAKIDKKKKAKWKKSRSARNGSFKKIKGFEDWFYTGPSLEFGHNPKRGGR